MTHSRQVVWIGGGIAGVFLIANAIVSLQSARRLIHNDMTVEQAYQQLNMVDNMFVALTDAEAGERGYVITGDVRYLEPFESACARAENSLDDLERHSQGNESQQMLVRELRILVETKLEYLSEIVSASRISPVDEESLVVQNESKRLMKQIWMLNNRISENALVQLEQSTIASETSVFRLKGAILLGMTTGLVFVLVAAYGMERHYRTRGKAEAALVEANRLSQSILDALQSHISVLDDKGTFVTTNLAWRNSAGANGPFAGLLSQDNYLEVCDRASELGSRDASAVAKGIRTILNGTETEFEFEYACNAKAGLRWFLVRVSRLASSGNVRLLVSHENITAVKQSQQEAENALAKLRDSNKALRTSEQRYRALADAMPQMV